MHSSWSEALKILPGLTAKMDPNDAAVLPSFDQPVNLNDAQIEKLAEDFLQFHIHNQIARNLFMTSEPNKHKSKQRRLKRTQWLENWAERTILSVLLDTVRHLHHGEHLDDALQKACKKKSRDLRAWQIPTTEGRSRSTEGSTVCIRNWHGRQKWQALLHKACKKIMIDQVKKYGTFTCA